MLPALPALRGQPPTRGWPVTVRPGAPMPRPSRPVVKDASVVQGAGLGVFIAILLSCGQPR